MGANGMIGHALLRCLGHEFDTWGTVRSPRPPLELCRHFTATERILTSTDLNDSASVFRVLDDVRPSVVVNCIGLTRQRDCRPDAYQQTNGYSAHWLARTVTDRGCRLIQLSTDCVFSGESGCYRETDIPDAREAYGVSKLAGESSLDGVLTLRKSAVGLEIRAGKSLLEWLLSHRNGHIRTFEKVMFSGVTTATLADLTLQIIAERPTLGGLFHVAAPSISKGVLLRRMICEWKLRTTVIQDWDTSHDRTLNADAFFDRTGFARPSWDAMFEQLARDLQLYRYRHDLESV